MKVAGDARDQEGRDKKTLPDFLRWEPGTSYRFCRTEAKKDEHSPKMDFAALKEIINDDCLESLHTKKIGRTLQ